MTAVEAPFASAEEAIAELYANKDRGDLEFVDEMLIAADFVVQFGTLLDVIESQARLYYYQNQSGGCAAWTFLTHWSYSRGDIERVNRHGFGEHMQTCPQCAYLEAVLGVSSSLDLTPCADCHRGGDSHVYSPSTDEDGELDWFNVGVWCREPWERAEPLVFQAGQLADYQLGDACAARWVAPLVDDTFAVVTRTYFLGEEPELGVFLQRDVEYLVCTDPARPRATTIANSYASDAVEVDDPEKEDLAALAELSPSPAPGEWTHHMPDSAGFLRE